MPGLIRRGVVLSKVQTGVGVDAAPVPELNALLVNDLNFAMEGTIIERQHLRDSLSRIAHRLGNNRMTANFTTELKSGPDVGSVPEWLPLMRMGGMLYANTTVLLSLVSGTYMWTASGSGTGEFYVELAAGGDPSLTDPDGVRENGQDMTRGVLGSLNPGQFAYGDNDALGYSTIYVRLTDDADPDSKAADFVQSATGGAITLTPRDTLHEFGSVYLYPDGLLVKVLDAMNVWSLNFTAGEIARMTNQIGGIFTAPTDVALPTTANYQAHLPPICESMLLTIDGFSTGIVQSFTIESGNAIGPNPDLNSPNGIHSYDLTGRAYTGTIVMQQELVATKDFYGIAANATEVAFTANLGTTPRRIQFSAPAIQLGNISSTDIQGKRGFSIPFFINQQVSSGLEFSMTLN